MPAPPTTTVVVPTHGRPQYLDVTLASVRPQTAAAGAELLVVADGADPRITEVAERHGARLVELPRPTGANAARNAALGAIATELVVFIDDDVEAPPGWLEAMLAGVRSAPDHDVFGGPIRARLEGGGPRACGREPPPITTLDLGPEDRDVSFVWSANIAIRTRAFAHVGAFDQTIFVRGDEEDWLRRYTAKGGRVRYVAAAGLDHRRTAEDSTTYRLACSAYGHGRAARRYDIRKGSAPPIAVELRTVAGCAWHTVRRRCAFGIVMGAQAAGRLREALAAIAPGHAPPRATDDFLSGTSGEVWGIRLTTWTILADALDDLVALAKLERWRLRRAARTLPRRRVLVLAIERVGAPNVLAQARAELDRTRHELRFASIPADDRGKFENLNALLADNPHDNADWLIVLDDDVTLPRGFLDSFLFLAERFGLQVAQPAHRRRSHAAWQVTRRRRASVARETAFVETGPVFAFRAPTFDVLLPFPQLRAGWGLDLHWSALARAHGWREGIIDATPIRHRMRRIAASYDRRAAVEEARTFLAERPYTRASQAQHTLVTHRSWG